MLGAGWGLAAALVLSSGCGGSGGGSSDAGVDASAEPDSGVDAGPSRTRWVEQFGGPLEDRFGAMDLDTEGNIILTGQFTEAIDFGGGALTATFEPRE